ncbi:tol-pal system protein YbgF [Alteromonas sp. ASW11-130]|uniref:tol-pal system protein YbgF n=1 Tax=Alteromonas sp. ASW11-130 TaxID=3015775 RepID=UPI002241B17D|nr:tol-pal system protein YbgF [Alteromonas sp. ASW11-130]MCW8091493.1 tol-pal system protein YbgF [Alteromonas sp. ASW11-130]
MAKAITDRKLSGSIARGATLCSALLVSVMVNAQAPVYDVNSSDNRGVNSSQGQGMPTGTVEQRIAVLERMVDSRTQMQHRLQQHLDAMQEEIDELRGAVEVHTNQLEKVLERQRELYLEIDKRVEALKQAGVVPISPSEDIGAVSSQPVVRPSVNQEDESTAYDNAVNLILQSREYDKAIPAFQAFIQRFPNSQYAPNAHYWLGQLLFNKQEWAQAQEQFEIVSNRFANSSKRADALLKLGVIAERQDNPGQARQFYQQVIEMYPNSSARKLAESRISGL